jgi:hypothetical protein
MKWLAGLIGTALVVVGFCGMIIARHDVPRGGDSAKLSAKGSGQLPTVRGIVLDGAIWDANADAAQWPPLVEQIAATGANWIELPILLDGRGGIDATKLAGLVTAAHKEKVGILLECRLPAAQRAALPTTERRQEQWVEGVWGPRVMAAARAADSAGVDLLCIGQGLDGVQERSASWLELIGALRNVYKGSLTYAADSQTYCYVQWWEQLDYISVAGNFPLSNKPDPQLDGTKCALDAQLDSLMTMNWHLYRPVLVVDAGYSANPAVAYDPNLKNDARPLRQDIQATCYQTALEATKGKSWLAGVFLKTWGSDGMTADDDLRGAVLKNLVTAEWHQPLLHVNP